MAHELIEMGMRKGALKRWTPNMGQHQIKGFPQAGTIGLSFLGALAAVGVDCTLNVTRDQIMTSPSGNKSSELVKNILPSFLVTTGLAGATWWLSGSKTAAFVIESVGLLYFVPKVVALFE